MGRRIKITGIILIGSIILIQFFQPERNKGVADSEYDLLSVVSAPDSISKILKNSCYNCHSNHTNYPWYSYISPLSWYLESHIKKGKDKMNLSNFGELEKSKKIGILTDICDVIESGEMPLKSYLLIHQDAKIEEEAREEICVWSEMEAMRLMRE